MLCPGSFRRTRHARRFRRTWRSGSRRRPRHARRIRWHHNRKLRSTVFANKCICIVFSTASRAILACAHRCWSKTHTFNLSKHYPKTLLPIPLPHETKAASGSNPLYGFAAYYIRPSTEHIRGIIDTFRTTCKTVGAQPTLAISPNFRYLYP